MLRTDQPPRPACSHTTEPYSIRSAPHCDPDRNLLLLTFSECGSPDQKSDVALQKKDALMRILRKHSCDTPVDLSYVDLSDMNLNGINLDNVIMNNAVFRNTRLRGASFNGAILKGAIFDGACLTGSRMENADLCKASFRKCALTSVNFTGSTMNHATFVGSDLSVANFKNAQAYKADFSKSSLINATNVQGRKMRSGGQKKTVPEKKWFYGIIRLMGSVVFRLNNHYRHSVNRFSGPALDNHVSSLLSALKNDGDVMVLTFANGFHSAIALRHHGQTYYLSSIQEDPTLLYTGVGCHTRLKNEIKTYDDSLTDLTPVSSDNIIYLKKMNTQAMLEKWKAGLGEYDILFNNCSSTIRYVLLKGAGVEPKDLKSFQHNCILQLPENTACLAREIANFMIKKNNEAIKRPSP